MINLHQKYCEETYDNNGILKSFKAIVPEDYNFGYDVIDVIAEAEPDRRAMLWCNDAGEEHTFTFGDLKKYSDKAANALLK